MLAALPAACLIFTTATAYAATFGPASTDGPGRWLDFPTAATMAAPGLAAIAAGTDGGDSTAPGAPGVTVTFRDRAGASTVVGTGEVHDDHQGPVIASDAKGTVTVAWTQFGREVLAAQCTRRGCTKARTLASDTKIGVGETIVAMDAAGRALVGWRTRARGAAPLQYRVIAQRKVGPVRTLSTAARESRVAAVGGRFIVAWTTSRGVRVASVPRSERAQVRAVTRAGAPTGLAVGSSSKQAFLAWSSGTTTVDVQGRPGRVAPLTGVRGALTLAANPAGRAVLVSTVCAASGPRVTARVREPGRGFGPAQVLDDQTQGCPKQASAAIDDAGRAVVGWATLTGAQPTQQPATVATAAPGATFGPAEPLDATPCTAPAGCRTSGPLLAAGGDDLFALWARDDVPGPTNVAWSAAG